MGHDTHLCLWDLTEDILRQSSSQRHRGSTIITIGTDQVKFFFNRNLLLLHYLFRVATISFFLS